MSGNLSSRNRRDKVSVSDEQLFWQRVTETREWCAMRIRSNIIHSKLFAETSTDDLQGILRSVEFGRLSLIPTWTPGFDKWAAEDNRCSLVDTLSDRRARMLADAGKHPDTVCEHVTAQRFVVYLPDINLADGAAAWVSHGYFDDDNVPPWDTWLMYFSGEPGTGQAGKLISWVPPQLTGLVDDAMRVNSEECIYWATEAQLFPGEEPVK